MRLASPRNYLPLHLVCIIFINSQISFCSPISSPFHYRALLFWVKYSFVRFHFSLLSQRLQEKSSNRRKSRSKASSEFAARPFSMRQKSRNACRAAGIATQMGIEPMIQYLQNCFEHFREIRFLERYHREDLNSVLLH